MFSVMVVDDEPIILKGISCLINWNDYGFDTPILADGGCETLEKYRDNPVDLVICDINMPDMNGIDLISRLKELNSDVVSVILSGYNEFSYAQKALELNVKAYLLKPVIEEELIAALSNIAAVISENRLRIRIQKKLLLTELLTSNIKTDFCSMNKGRGFYYATVIPEKEFDGVLQLVHTNQSEYTVKTISRCITQIIGEEYDYFIIEKFDALRCDFVISDAMLNSLSLSVSELANKIYRQLKVSVLIGKKVNGITDIKQSKASIKALLTERFYKRNKTVIFAKNTTETAAGSDVIGKKHSDNILKAAETDADISGAVSEFIKEITQNGINEEYVTDYISNIVMSFYNKEVTFTESPQILSKLHVYKNIENKTVNHTETFLSDICEELKTASQIWKKRQKLGVVSDIINYLNENFHKDCTLINVAAAFYINPTYLGHIFKEKIGVNYNNYLNTLRINKAKELLHAGKKVNETAYEIGYNDPNYFSKKFSEFESCTPSEYQEKYLKE